MKSSILIVCEIPEQLTGSGCCGKLEGPNAYVGGRCVFEERRRQKEEIGRLFLRLKGEFAEGEAEVIQVDPRNQLYLWSKICADVVRHRPRFWSAVKSLSMMFPVRAILVNGEVLFSNGVFDEDEVFEKIKVAVRN